MKNKILWLITNINVVSFIVMASALDSDTWIPFIVLCVNMIWLVLFGVVNFDYFERRYHGI